MGKSDAMHKSDASYRELVDLKSRIEKKYPGEFKMKILIIRKNPFNTRCGYEIKIKPVSELSIYLRANGWPDGKRKTAPIIDGKITPVLDLIE